MYKQVGRFHASYNFFANFALVSLCFLFFYQVPLKTSAYFSCVEGIKYKGICFMLGFVYNWAGDTAGNLKLSAFEGKRRNFKERGKAEVVVIFV